MLQNLRKHMLVLALLGMLSPVSAALAQSSGDGLAVTTFSTTSANELEVNAELEQALGDSSPASPGTSAVLGKDVQFSVQLVHSVKFPLTTDRCYYQFFVDAKGSNALDDVRFDMELALEGRIVGTTSAVVSDLDGNMLSKRIREFAFDGPCRLDGVRVIAATGGFAPLGAQFTVPVDLFERNSVSTADFEPLEVALGDTAPLPGAKAIQAQAITDTDNLERACIKQVSNLRTGPGTEYNIVTVLQPGTATFIEKRTGDGTWNRIRTQFGRQGWVYYTLLQDCPS